MWTNSLYSWLLVRIYTHEVWFKFNVLPLMVKGDATTPQEKDMYPKFDFWNVGS